jgi:pseudouridine-5'-phosphate glycosidase
MNHYGQFMDIEPEVRRALENGQPVVALESTIISHGMPYPQNLEMAKDVEEEIRKGGAVPATIAILGGRIKIGLSEPDLLLLATAPDVEKTSRRDLPYIIAEKKHGATTVATTMILAHLAGIKVFVTGGIGGVHRGAQESFDISADLQELANTSVLVVCAGAKSILDIGLTLEYLETYGVPVLGYQTKDFPAFYTRESGYFVDYAVETAESVAMIAKTKWDLNLKGGIVLANPIPVAYEMPKAQITEAIELALKEASEKGIKGKDSTPFLLKCVKELTGGDSLDSNIQLVLNNARVGAAVAVALHQ